MTHPLYELALRTGNPVIQGNLACFVWKGRNAPRLIDDLHLWGEHPQKLQRIGKDLWVFSIELENDAYLEYSFIDPRKKTHLKDPLNTNTVPSGTGQTNHFFYMPGGSPTPDAVKRKGVTCGRVTHHTVETWMLQDGGKRKVHLYHPPLEGPVPLLVVYDGADYLKRSRLNVIVDNLIHENRIRPLAIAFLHNGDDRRGVEYACSDATLKWLDHVVLPLAHRQINLVDIEKQPGAHGVLGASFGGLMALYTGLRMPEIFGRVISQSGVFESEGRDFAAVDLIRCKQSRQIDIWMDVGRFDGLLEDNRRLQPILQGNGYNVTYHEFTGGHNYTCWQNELPRALEALYGI